MYSMEGKDRNQISSTSEEKFMVVPELVSDKFAITSTDLLIRSLFDHQDCNTFWNLGRTGCVCHIATNMQHIQFIPPRFFQYIDDYINALS